MGIRPGAGRGGSRPALRQLLLRLPQQLALHAVDRGRRRLGHRRDGVRRWGRGLVPRNPGPSGKGKAGERRFPAVGAASAPRSSRSRTRCRECNSSQVWTSRSEDGSRSRPGRAGATSDRCAGRTPTATGSAGGPLREAFRRTAPCSAGPSREERRRSTCRPSERRSHSSTASEGPEIRARASLTRRRAPPLLTGNPSSPASA